jgi:hypothetical protein
MFPVAQLAPRADAPAPRRLRQLSPAASLMPAGRTVSVEKKKTDPECGYGARLWCECRGRATLAESKAPRRRTGMLSIDELFKGRHFDICVRWYLRFKLSFRDLVEMMAERGVALAHTRIMRWVQRYVPEFEKRWNRFACKVGQSWRVDETYVKIKGRWTTTINGIELMHRIRKGQFNVSKLRVNDNTASNTWNAVLAA